MHARIPMTRIRKTSAQQTQRHAIWLLILNKLPNQQSQTNAANIKQCLTSFGYRY
jgi:hypothetical protein